LYMLFLSVKPCRFDSTSSSNPASSFCFAALATQRPLPRRCA
jgi:hypothetical protein